MARVENLFQVSFPLLITKLYRDDKLSTLEISEKLHRESGIHISPRHLQRVTKSLGIERSFNQAFRLAIAKGRKDYSKLRKPIRARDFRIRKGISLNVCFAGEVRPEL